MLTEQKARLPLILWKTHLSDEKITVHAATIVLFLTAFQNGRSSKISTKELYPKVTENVLDSAYGKKCGDPGRFFWC